jgi:excisionase family DNA binding protein
MLTVKEKRSLSTTDRQDVRALYHEVLQSRAKLLGPDGAATSFPSSLQEFLAKMLQILGEGLSLSIVQHDAQLTTAEAARILGVSRQFLVGLLEQGAIPHHKAGTHRRILVRDLLAYKAKRDTRRHEVLDALTGAEASDGLYDLDARKTRHTRS